MNTITIKIKYTAQLKKSVGKGEEWRDVPGDLVVSQILKQLSEIHKEAFHDIVFNDQGEFLNAVLLILNGQQINYNSDQVIRDKDELTVMAPIAGG